MAYRKMGTREDQKHRNAAASMSISEALLFATISIIGMPVEVHTIDGAIYSGTFYTASMDNYDEIVLKKAKMMKKGNRDVNVSYGSLIETLIIKSADFIQVVVKGVHLPSNGCMRNVAGDGLQAIAGHIEGVEGEANVSETSKVNKRRKSKKRSSAKRNNEVRDSSTAKIANGSKDSLEGHIEGLNAMQSVQINEAHSISLDESRFANGSVEIQSDSKSSTELQSMRTTREDQQFIVNIDDYEARTTTNIPEEISAPSVSKANAYIESVPFVDSKSESSLSADSLQFIPPKSLSLQKPVKESKLNPGAKLFSPSTLHNKSVNPPLLPNGANYMPDSYAMAPYANALPTLPLKFIPYSNDNMVVANGTTDAQYGQPIMGQMVGRILPTQYNNFRTGENFINPNPQNVMYAARTYVTPHQMHQVAKHQGNGLGQTMQMYMTPQGPQPYIMPNIFPVPPPVFPVLRPRVATGPNGFMKFT